MNATVTPTSSTRSADPNSYRYDAEQITMLGARSDTTGDLFWPPRLRCPVTGGTVSSVVLASTGTIWSWTFVYTPWHGMEAPSRVDGYAAGLVDLDDDGPRVAAILIGEPETWSVGDRARTRALRLTTDDDGATLALLAFERVTA